MAYMTNRSLRASAMLRALADMAESYPFVYPEFSATADLQVGEINDSGSQAVVVQFSGQFLAKQPEFLTALFRAYKQHGGEPSVFFTEAIAAAQHAVS